MSDTKQVFSPDQRSLLSEVLNRIIPPKDKLPGAGNLGIAAYIEGVVAADTSLTRLFNEGLAKISVAAGQDSPKGFGSLSNTAKDDLLRAVESANPVFFDRLVLHTYNGYYTNQEVFDALGYKLPGTPAPGAQPELLDVSLLDQQRKREPFWKKV
ncbi:MAG: gluconate 2-dehydrogenase subunit 3 family protein [Chloroflexi bacterium]|nr:gluconate 2-dehydrogenase subunit 3 family protein [Chloroflexota bacterium]